MNLGPIIKQLRERRRWTQDELAHQAGTTAANISRIEAGKHRPSAELLGSIAYVLELKIYELIALSEGLTPPALQPGFDADEELLVSYYRKMPTEQKELFKAIGASFCRLRRSG
jgi:transcriptional regulator with XRE-family HTH domain